MIPDTVVGRISTDSIRTSKIDTSRDDVTLPHLSLGPSVSRRKEVDVYGGGIIMGLVIIHGDLKRRTSPASRRSVLASEGPER